MKKIIMFLTIVMAYLIAFELPVLMLSALTFCLKNFETAYGYYGMIKIVCFIIAAAYLLSRRWVLEKRDKTLKKR